MLGSTSQRAANKAARLLNFCSTFRGSLGPVGSARGNTLESSRERNGQRSFAFGTFALGRLFVGPQTAASGLAPEHAEIVE